MYASRCFTASRGSTTQMGCVSCHDPHALPPEDQKVAYYRGRCLQCHQEQSCSLPPPRRRETVADDNCVACHMPRAKTTDIVHTAVTDHRIVRAPRPSRPPASRSLSPGEIPITHFHADQVAPDDPEVARDLGLALVDLAKERTGASRQLSETALGFLDAAVRRGPDDTAAWAARGQALGLLGKSAEARASVEHALTLAPSREISLADAAGHAEDVGDRASAIGYWERVREIDPWAASPRMQLARLWSDEKKWEQAAKEWREVVRINPAHTEARMLLVKYYLQTGDRSAARAEFETVRALHPPDLESLRRWYEAQTR